MVWGLNPGRVKIFCTVQTGLPASYTIGIGSVSGVKLPGRGIHPHTAQRLK
jgi:hypothetical protein